MRSLRGGDTQAATKSSLADIERRKKGIDINFEVLNSIKRRKKRRRIPVFITTLMTSLS